MSSELITKSAKKLQKAISGILPGISFKEESGKHYSGWSYKYAPRGKSHHFIGFGMAHEENGKNEFQLEMGAIKFREDFKSLKRKLNKILKANPELRIEEAGEAYLIRYAEPIPKWTARTVNKAMAAFVQAIAETLHPLQKTDFLGEVKFEIPELEPAAEQEEKPKKIKQQPAPSAPAPPDQSEEIATLKQKIKDLEESHAKQKASAEKGWLEAVDQELNYGRVLDYIGEKDALFKGQLSKGAKSITNSDIRNALNRIAGSSAPPKPKPKPKPKKEKPVPKVKSWEVIGTISFDERSGYKPSFGSKLGWSDPKKFTTYYHDTKAPSQKLMKHLIAEYLISKKRSFQKWKYDSGRGILAANNTWYFKKVRVVVVSIKEGIDW